MGADICTIAIGEETVEVQFAAGARLADPDKLLEGWDREVRRISITKRKAVPSEAFERLVAQAFVMNAG